MFMITLLILPEEPRGGLEERAGVVAPPAGPLYIYICIYVCIHIYIFFFFVFSPTSTSTALATRFVSSTVSFHNFKSQDFKLSVSDPESKHVAYVSVLSRISNCQGLGRKNRHEILKTDRNCFCMLRIIVQPLYMYSIAV